MSAILAGFVLDGRVRPEAARQLLAAQPSKSRPSLFVGRTAEFDPKLDFGHSGGMAERVDDAFAERWLDFRRLG